MFPFKEGSGSIVNGRCKETKCKLTRKNKSVAEVDQQIKKTSQGNPDKDDL